MSLEMTNQLGQQIVEAEKYFEKYRAMIPATEKYIYMNSGGCGPMPGNVLRSMEDIFEKMTEEGQVNPEVHRWLKQILEDVRIEVAQYINAKPEEIFFVRCIAEGLNTIVRMFPWSENEEILISNQENPASILPCYSFETIMKIVTKEFEGRGNKEDIISSFKAGLGEKTKLAVMSHVFHTTGAEIPARELCRMAEERGVVTVLDGAQAAGNIPIDVKDIGCSFYLLSCHKWLLGPEGIAAVYIREDLIDKVRVPFGGVGMQDDFDSDTHQIHYKPSAKRFEYGGRHIPMYAAFGETIRFAKLIGTDRIYAHTRLLHQYLRQQIELLETDIEFLSPEDERLQTAIFALRIPGKNHREIVKRAWEEERLIIQWRTENLRTKEEGLRISLNWFVQKKDIDKLVKFLKRMIEE